MKSLVWAGAMLLLACGLGTVSAPAEATIYKCRDAHGAIVFSDRGCAHGDLSSRPVATPAPVVTAPVTVAPVSPEPVTVVPPPATAVAVEAGPVVETVIEPAVKVAAEPAADSISSAVSAAELPAEPLRARKAKSGNWLLVGVGVAAGLVAYVLMIVVAFRAGSVGWGIALILLSPITNLLYTLFHFREARASFALLVAAAAICFAAYVPPADLIEVSDSYLTTRGTTDIGEKRSRVTFSPSETVYLKTVLDWEDWSVARPHFVGWVWYTNDQPGGSHMMQLEFDETPFVLLGYMPAAELGSGQHRVEVYVDGELFDSRSFEVL